VSTCFSLKESLTTSPLLYSLSWSSTFQTAPESRSLTVNWVKWIRYWSEITVASKPSSRLIFISDGRIFAFLPRHGIEVAKKLGGVKVFRISENIAKESLLQDKAPCSSKVHHPKPSFKIDIFDKNLNLFILIGAYSLFFFDQYDLYRKGK